jgi:uncharacterized protein (TIGR02757 family)
MQFVSGMKNTQTPFFKPEESLIDFLNHKADFYNNPSFIEVDPISIPHQFSKKEDIEIAGFFAATIAWGVRKSILTNGRKLMNLMENDPHLFIMNHSQLELKRFENFVHRTFNGLDVVYFITSLKHIYVHYGGLSSIFERLAETEEKNLQQSISAFREVFFELTPAGRTKKHVSNPIEGSAAKRINMFLRWMVRKDKKGVDFGLWNISPALLSCPLDVHSGRIARELGLLSRTANDWRAVEELDNTLRWMNPLDPAKYDFALFGLGAEPDWKG